MTTNEDGTPKKFGGKNKPDKKENKTGGKPNYQKGRGGFGKTRGKRSNWKRGRKASRANRKKFSKK